MLPEVVVTAALVFLRLVGVIAGLPIFDAQGTPRHAVILGALPVSAVPTSIAGLVGAVVLELLYGALLSLGVRATFAAVAMAGELLSIQAGFAMATLFDPLERGQSSALGTLAVWLSGMAFLSAGLHLRAIEIVGRSFELVPPGQLRPGSSALPGVIEAVGTHFALGVQLAGPFLALVFVVNVVMAVLARLAPRMNVFFSIGMTTTAIGSLALLFVALPWLLAVHLAALEGAVALLQRIVGP